MTTLKEKLGITRFVVYLIVMVLTIGACYGTISTRLGLLEKRTFKYQPDHELILILNTKMDRLSEDLKDIKFDLKDLKNQK